MVKAKNNNAESGKQKETTKNKKKDGQIITTELVFGPLPLEMSNSAQL